MFVQVATAPASTNVAYPGKGKSGWPSAPSRSQPPACCSLLSKVLPHSISTRMLGVVVQECLQGEVHLSVIPHSTMGMGIQTVPKPPRRHHVCPHLHHPGEVHAMEAGGGQNKCLPLTTTPCQMSVLFPPGKEVGCLQACPLPVPVTWGHGGTQTSGEGWWQKVASTRPPAGEGRGVGKRRWMGWG